MRKLTGITKCTFIILAIAFCVACGRKDRVKQRTDISDYTSLKNACEQTNDVLLMIQSDILITDSLFVSDSEFNDRYVTIDVNGHSLTFYNQRALYIGSEEYPHSDKRVFVTLANSENTGNITFTYNSDDMFRGGISVNDTLILDGEIVIKTEPSTFSDDFISDVSFDGIVGVGDNGKLIMNGGTINGDDTFSMISFGGNITINGGVINGRIENWGGKLQINGGSIIFDGDDGYAVTSEDTYVPLAPPIGSEIEFSDKRGENFNMTGGSILATGRNSIAVGVEENFFMTGGSIIATGEDSVGLQYYYVGRPNEEHDQFYVRFFGGEIKGEKCAIADRRGSDPHYLNKDGIVVPVERDAKEVS